MFMLNFNVQCSSGIPETICQRRTKIGYRFSLDPNSGLWNEYQFFSHLITITRRRSIRDIESFKMHAQFSHDNWSKHKKRKRKNKFHMWMKIGGNGENCMHGRCVCVWIDFIGTISNIYQDEIYEKYNYIRFMDTISYFVVLKTKWIKNKQKIRNFFRCTWKMFREVYYRWCSLTCCSIDLSYSFKSWLSTGVTVCKYVRLLERFMVGFYFKVRAFVENYHCERKNHRNENNRSLNMNCITLEINWSQTWSFCGEFCILCIHAMDLGILGVLMVFM